MRRGAACGRGLRRAPAAQRPTHTQRRQLTGRARPCAAPPPAPCAGLPLRATLPSAQQTRVRGCAHPAPTAMAAPQSAAAVPPRTPAHRHPAGAGSRVMGPPRRPAGPPPARRSAPLTMLLRCRRFSRKASQTSSLVCFRRSELGGGSPPPPGVTPLEAMAALHSELRLPEMERVATAPGESLIHTPAGLAGSWAVQLADRAQDQGAGLVGGRR